MTFEIDDVRIQTIRPLMAPGVLIEDLPRNEAQSATVAGGRAEIEQILTGADDRLVLVVGPCSIHDPEAGLEYARHLALMRERYRRDLCIIMRVYFEKPRTTVGWKGLINDPHLDGSFAIREGLYRARKFLLGVTDLGLPTGTEFLDPITPQFYADLVSWGAIGARTTESQVHRELASGLSMPVGFKNGTSGTVQLAIDGIGAAAGEHHFLSVTKHGVGGIVATRGNPHCHVILRGGSSGPNFDADSIRGVEEQLLAAGLANRIMVDCSHANSGKDHENRGREPAAFAIPGKRGSRPRTEHHGQVYELGANGAALRDACASRWETERALVRSAGPNRRRSTCSGRSARGDHSGICNWVCKYSK